MTHFNTRRFTTGVRAAALASGLLALTPAALYAQTPPAETGPPVSAQEPAAAAAPATTVPDTKIDQFAAAYVAVTDPDRCARATLDFIQRHSGAG